MQSTKQSAPPQPTAEADSTVVSVVLRNDQIVFLDEVAILFRRHAGASLSRSGMIRAIADAALPLYRDWLTCRSEEELKQRIGLQISRGATAARTTVPAGNR